MPGCCTLQLRQVCTACILACVSSQRKVQRYAAYFKGWCQAFGEHENLSREVLGKQRESPNLTISQDCVRVSQFYYRLSTTEDQRGTDALRQILDNSGDLYLYLTYHFLYRSGTRIITLSRKQPLTIIYKQISPMYIKLS